MVQKFTDYDSKLDVLEDLISNVSNLIPILDSNNVYTKREFATYKEQLTGAKERFEFIVNELNNMAVPELVIKDHEVLINEVRAFVHGCTLMKDCISIEEGIR